MKRVLVVDDDASALKPLCTLLKLDGIEVAAFARGEDAVAALGRERFDAVITDLEMPVVDGLEVIRVARRTQREGIPVVVVSASSRASDAKTHGASDVLSKPVVYDHLLAALSYSAA